MEYEALMQAARDAREHAWCPYSHFAVGAALLAENGTIYTGCNVENASYPLCTCAERTAICKAISDGQRKFRAIAICGTPDTEICSPCGACRQILAEFCDDDLKIILSDGVHTLGELLPMAFRLKHT